MNDKLFDLVLDEPSHDALSRANIEADPALQRAWMQLLGEVELLRCVALEPLDPPAGLAEAAIAYTAAKLVEAREYTTADGFVDLRPFVEPRRPRLPDWSLTRQHINAAVLCCVVFLSVMLGIVAVQKARAQADLANCKDHLRQVHCALTGYSEQNAGNFPQPGTLQAPVAGDFLRELERMGQPIDSAARWCPSVGSSTVLPVGYAYALGFRDETGSVLGLHRPRTAEDLTPIVADLPMNSAHPHRGWNVLSVGGSVQFTRQTTLGDTGDDLFTNAAGQHRAGLFRGDHSLGSPFDRP